MPGKEENASKPKMPAVGSMGEGIAAIRRGSGQGESFGKTALSHDFAAYANDRSPMLIAVAVTDRMTAANDLPAHSRGRPDTKRFAASPSFPIRRAAS